jgi:hypothetical protein
MADEPTPTRPDEQEHTTAPVEAPREPPPAAEPVAEEPAAAQRAAAEEEPPSEAVIVDATAPVGSAEAVEPSVAEEPPAPAAEEPPTAEQPPTPAAEEPPTADQQPAAAAEATPASEPAGGEGDAAPDERDGKGRGKGKPKRERPRRERGPRRDRPPRQPQQRATGPLPFQELREAATAVVDLFGARQALRDAFSALGEKERRDLARLVAEDGDWRVRARNIAAGSLGAGRVGKALAAQQISMARVEDLWPLTLSKEEAAERQARIRNARRRDERRAQRDAERDQRSDRVSRADLEKAQDGRVGAQIRIVIGGNSRDRRRKGDEDAKDQPTTSDLLDRLGY